MLFYESYEACLDAVVNGDVDATYCNSPIGNYYSTFPKYSHLSFLTAFETESSYCMGVALVLTLLFAVFYVFRIKKKNAELAAANKTKTDFMSRMSHDMRTPMNGILGLTQLTREETNMDAIHTNLNQIELSGHVLLDLINDTLDMNKIDAVKLIMETLSVTPDLVKDRCKIVREKRGLCRISSEWERGAGAFCCFKRVRVCLYSYGYSYAGYGWP